MTVETTKPLEIPRISAEISTDINDLRLRAIRGEEISIEEYAAGIKKIRQLFGARVAAKQVAAPKSRATASVKKSTKKTLSVQDSDDLLAGL